MQEKYGNPNSIAYASRLCTAAENNYIIIERETLAAIYCLEHFRGIMLGYKIRVWTDHIAIQNLFKNKNLRGRLARWFVTLQNIEINFEHIPGKKNTTADALSRNIVSHGEVNNVIPKELVPNVLYFIHDCATSSHQGKEKAYRQAQLKYYWTDMRKQIFNQKQKNIHAHQHQC